MNSKTVQIAIVVMFTGLSTIGWQANAQLESVPGGFGLYGYGARGAGMGNAAGAVTTGRIAALYNPALAPFQSDHQVYTSHAFLSLDRQLEYISYTKSLTLRHKGARHFEDDPDIQSIAGVSFSWVHAGVSNIDGRDADGFKTGELSTFENQFSITVANRFSDRFSIGLNFKFYYSQLYQDVTSSGFGFDIGILYSLFPRFTIGLITQELGSKYEWDTSKLYGVQNGNQTTDPFARHYRIAGSYLSPDSSVTIGAEVDVTSRKTTFARLGVEYRIVPQVTVRAGVDNLEITDTGMEPRPSFGFTVWKPLAAFVVDITYAFIVEPVAPSSTHVLSVIVLL